MPQQQSHLPLRLLQWPHGARGRHVAHAGTGHGVSAQLSPTKATGAVEAAARAKAAKANKAKGNAIMKCL